MGNDSGIAIAAILIIGILLFGGVIFTFLAGAIPSAVDWISDLIAKLTGGGGGGEGSPITGTSAIAFKVHFTDGSVKEINQNMAYSIFPLSISFEGKTVSSIEVNVLAKIQGEGVSSWSSTATVHTELYKKPETTPKTSATGTFDNGGTSWSSGAIKTLATYTVTGAQLDSIAAQYGDGNYLLQVTATLRLTVTPAGGTAMTYEATPLAGGLDITYTGGAPTGVTYSIAAPKTLTANP